jgi:uncharacterized protein (DUF3084 family)
MNTAEIVVPIAVATITAVIPASIAALVQVRKLRRENTEQHDKNVEHLQANHALLTTIHDDVKDVRQDIKQVRSDLDKHLGEHEATKAFRRVK